jgi:hypothetical protein
MSFRSEDLRSKTHSSHHRQTHSNLEEMKKKKLITSEELLANLPKEFNFEGVKAQRNSRSKHSHYDSESAYARSHSYSANSNRTSELNSSINEIKHGDGFGGLQSYNVQSQYNLHKNNVEYKNEKMNSSLHSSYSDLNKTDKKNENLVTSQTLLSNLTDDLLRTTKSVLDNKQTFEKEQLYSDSKTKGGSKNSSITNVTHDRALSSASVDDTHWVHNKSGMDSQLYHETLTTRYENTNEFINAEFNKTFDKSLPAFSSPIHTSTPIPREPKIKFPHASPIFDEKKRDSYNADFETETKVEAIRTRVDEFQHPEPSPNKIKQEKLLEKIRQELNEEKSSRQIIDQIVKEKEAKFLSYSPQQAYAHQTHYNDMNKSEINHHQTYTNERKEENYAQTTQFIEPAPVFNNHNEMNTDKMNFSQIMQQIQQKKANEQNLNAFISQYIQNPTVLQTPAKQEFIKTSPIANVIRETINTPQYTQNIQQIQPEFTNQIPSQQFVSEIVYTPSSLPATNIQKPENKSKNKIFKETTKLEYSGTTAETQAQQAIEDKKIVESVVNQKLTKVFIETPQLLYPNNTVASETVKSTPIVPNQDRISRDVASPKTQIFTAPVEINQTIIETDKQPELVQRIIRSPSPIPQQRKINQVVKESHLNNEENAYVQSPLSSITQIIKEVMPRSTTPVQEIKKDEFVQQNKQIHQPKILQTKSITQIVQEALSKSQSNQIQQSIISNEAKKTPEITIMRETISTPNQQIIQEVTKTPEPSFITKVIRDFVPTTQPTPIMVGVTPEPKKEKIISRRPQEALLAF